MKTEFLSLIKCMNVILFHCRLNITILQMKNNNLQVSAKTLHQDHNFSAMWISLNTNKVPTFSHTYISTSKVKLAYHCLNKSPQGYHRILSNRYKTWDWTIRDKYNFIEIRLYRTRTKLPLLQR